MIPEHRVADSKNVIPTKNTQRTLPSIRWWWWCIRYWSLKKPSVVHTDRDGNMNNSSREVSQKDRVLARMQEFLDADTNRDLVYEMRGWILKYDKGLWDDDVLEQKLISLERKILARLLRAREGTM